MLRLTLALGVAVAACHRGGVITRPPPPQRPAPQVSAPAPTVTDCVEVLPSQGEPVVPFGDREIAPAAARAAGGQAKLRAAESSEVDRPVREALVTEAVADLIDALNADPYNVAATYGLARAYALVGRDECALNFLARLIEMRGHPSRAAAVAERLDALLGVRQLLDPAFSGLRGHARFRALVTVATTMPSTGPVTGLWVPPGGLQPAPTSGAPTPATSSGTSVP